MRARFVGIALIVGFGAMVPATGAEEGFYFRYGTSSPTAPKVGLPDPDTNAPVPADTTRPLVLEAPPAILASVATRSETTLAASNAMAPLTWGADPASLPPGMTFDGGKLAGTPTQPGFYDVPVTVRDASGRTASATVSYEVRESLVARSYGAFAARTGRSVSGSGFEMPGIFGATWTIVGSALPTGLSLAQDGTLSGATTQAGNYPVSARGARNGAMTQVGPVTLRIAPFPSLSLSGANARAGFPISIAPKAIGILGSPSYALGGTLPAGLSFTASTGLIDGTPSAAGPLAVSVTVSDSFDGEASAPASVSLDIREPLAVSGFPARISLVNGVAMAPLTGSVSGKPVSPLSWSLGGKAPTGIALDATLGRLSGTPSKSGVTEGLYVRAADAEGFVAEYGPFVVAVAPAPSFTMADLTATVGYALNATATASDVTGTAKYEIVTGTLPTTLTLDPATGAITGTPTAIAEYPLSIRLTDLASGASGTKDILVRVMANEGVDGVFPSVSVNGTTAPVAALYDIDSATTVTAAAGTGMVLTFDRPRLADGITVGGSGSWELHYLNPSKVWTLASSGTGAVTAATFSSGAITASAWRWRPTSGTRAVPTVRILYGMVAPTAPSVTPATYRPDIGVAFNQSLGSQSAVGPVTWRVTSGTMPDGLSLSLEGVVSGTPTAYGVSTPMVTLVDARGIEAVARPMTLDVQTDATAAIAFPLTASIGEVGTWYDTNPVSYAYVNNSNGLVLTFDKPVKANGFQVASAYTTVSYAFEYQPLGTSDWVSLRGFTTGKSASFENTTARTWRVRAQGSGTGAELQDARVTFSGQAPTSPSITDPGDLKPVAGLPYTYKLRAINVVDTGTWSVAEGSSLPSGLTLASDGTLSGIPGDIRESTALVTLTDSRGVRAVPFPIQFKVQSPLLASDAIPASVSVGEVGTYYDRNASTQATLRSASSPTEITFSEPIQVNGAIFAAPSASVISFRVAYQPVGTSDWVTTTVGTSVNNVLQSFTNVTAKAFRVWQTSYSSVVLSDVRLTYSGAAPITPSVNDPGILKPTLGQYASFQVTAANVKGTQTWSLDSGALPQGMSLDSSGFVLGTPTSFGETSAFVSMVDERGVRAVPTEVKLKVQSPLLASDAIPASVSVGEVGTYYDRNTTTQATLRTASNPTEITFADPVQVTGALFAAPSASVISFRVAYQPVGTTEWVTTTIGTTDNNVAQTFPNVTARAFRVWQTSYGSVPVSDIRLTYGGTAPTTPSVNAPGAIAPTVGTAYTMTLTAANLGTSPTWSIVSGAFPNGFDLSPAGVLSGTATSTTAGTALVTVTDARGVRAVPLSITVSPK